ncbi:MAG: hypothetical protein L0H79_18700 [Intrasporangium sp.]|uniref:hypothetical protein n=1 Tax=Intrasporangium sp. TaxID=1925024 RepID=UPI002649FEF8|nr:hypothetical protein [Intrasporangium sp.]MDN5797758.1 hypothetical protein [Intrasporangium sp.]
MERFVAAQGPDPSKVSSEMTVISPTPAASQPAVPQVVEASSGDGKTGWCSTLGCWYLYRGDKTTTTYHAAAYDGTGYYGYDSTTIGSVSFHIYDYLPNSTLVKMTNQHKVSDAASPYNKWWASNLLVNAGV